MTRRLLATLVRDATAVALRHFVCGTELASGMEMDDRC